MPTHHLFGGAALALLLGVAATTAPQPDRRSPPQDPAPAPGHLVLVVEGDVTALRITAAVAKPDAFGGVPKGLVSDFAWRAVDGKGNELARVPIDLSAFDTDPRNVGKPVVVTGCEVRSARIGVLLNVPVVAGAVRFEIVRTEPTAPPKAPTTLVLGQVAADELAALLRGGR